MRYGKTLFLLEHSLTEGEDYYEELKKLAKGDISVLKNLINLHKLYSGDDPQLTSKEADLAIGILLQKLYQKNPRAAHYLGKLTWEAELVNWVGFLDQIGDQTLAQYLGINSTEEIPIGQASGIGDEMGLDDDPEQSDLEAAIMDDEGSYGMDEPEPPEEEVPHDIDVDADELAAALRD